MSKITITAAMMIIFVFICLKIIRLEVTHLVQILGKVRAAVSRFNGWGAPESRHGGATRTRAL
jgi:hypothetical protein